MIIVCTAMAIIGALYVSYNKPLVANYFWVISNAGFILYNLSINEYEMTILFSTYEIIAIFGIYNLRFKND